MVCCVDQDEVEILVGKLNRNWGTCTRWGKTEFGQTNGLWSVALHRVGLELAR